jgi:hypothetical protein
LNEVQLSFAALITKLVIVYSNNKFCLFPWKVSFA